MKKIIAALVVLGLAAVLIMAYRAASKEQAAEREREKPVASEAKASRNTNGEPVLSLDEEAQKRIGLQFGVLAEAQLAPELRAYGRVLDPSLLGVSVADLMAARASATASEKELERSRLLSANAGASVRALQAAEAAALRDQAAVDSLQLRLLATWGDMVTNNEAEMVQLLVKGENALVRVDLLAGEVIKGLPVGARLLTLAKETKPIEAEVMGPAPSVEAQTQGQGFFLRVRSRQPGLSPGAAVAGYLRTAGESRKGLVIPSAAVTRFGGKAWVYVEAGKESFIRREISLEIPLNDGWFVTEGFKAGDRVVVTGARLLLSEEEKNQIRMGD